MTGLGGTAAVRNVDSIGQLLAPNGHSTLAPATSETCRPSSMAQAPVPICSRRRAACDEAPMASYSSTAWLRSDLRMASSPSKAACSVRHSSKCGARDFEPVRSISSAAVTNASRAACSPGPPRHRLDLHCFCCYKPRLSVHRRRPVEDGEFRGRP